MSSTTVRWSARLGVAALAVGVAAPAAFAAVAWSPVNTADKATGTATGAATWSYGSNFDKTDNGKVWNAYTTDKPGGTWASDTGPYQGVYVRSGVGASGKTVAWQTGAGQRISQLNQHSDRATLATAGNNVFATWVTVASYDNYDPAKPRPVYFRANVAGWKPTVALTTTSARTDYPVVAAAGSNVYVAWTNSNTGDVVLRRSTNNGGAWGTATKLGTTTRVDPDDAVEGKAAWPSVCASGSNVALVYLPAASGDVTMRLSTDGGTTFGAAKSLGAKTAGSDRGWAQCDLEGTRIGVAWSENDGVYYAEYNANGSTTTARKKVVALPSGSYVAAYAVTPALIGTGKVGIAAPLCLTDLCDYNSNKTKIDLTWLESGNNGGTFAAPVVLAKSSVAGKALNDSPAALWFDATTRYVLYNGWTSGYTNYRLYLATGLGS